MVKPEILIIDDSVAWADTIAQVIGNEYITHTVFDFDQALNLIEHDPRISMVITEIVLDTGFNHDMYSFTKGIIYSIKHLRPNLPIIAMTTFPLKKSIDYKKLGVDYLFTKSNLNLNVFRIAVSTILNKNNSNKTNSNLLVETRKILNKELERYALIKEKTLFIPDEGNFELIKPLIGFKRDIERKISKFPYSRNVFLMMKFRDNNKYLSDYIIENLQKRGLNGVRADQNEWNITRNVYNPIAVLHCCKFGIALFDEAENNQTYSPNVAYELGIMHSHNKNCLILKHKTLSFVPFDLVKDIYISYEKDLELKGILLNWINQIDFPEL